MVFFLIEKEKIKEYNVNVLGGEPKNILKRRKYKMKKMIKKIAAAFMAMALVAVGMLAANKAEVKAATIVSVTVSGSGAETMATGDNGKLYFHSWGGYVTGDWNAAPEMTNNGDGTWTIEDLTCSSALNCIIKNANGQTGNIEGIAVDKAEIFIEIPAEGDPIVTYGNAAAPEEDPDAGVEKDTITINVKYDGVTWGGANFHYWDHQLQGAPGWPGVSLDAQPDGTYKGTVLVKDGVTTIGGIVNYDGNQTGDITGIDVTTGSVYIVVKGTTVDLIDVYTDGFPSAGNDDDEEETTTAADDDEDETTTVADDDDEDETTTAADDDETTAADDDDETTAGDVEEDTNTYHVAGEAGLCGEAWNPAANQMTKNDDGTWSIKFTDVKAGTYAFKVATNGAWDNGEYNLEGDASNNGPNASITVAEDGTTVIISFDGEKAIITMNAVPAGSGEDTPAGDSSMVAIFAILAVLAAAGVVTVAVAKRRVIEE